MSTIRRGSVLVAGLVFVAACTGGTAEIPAAVCVGEATTYLDWLNGDLQPDVQDAIEEADPAGDLLETIQEAGVIRIATDANYEPQSFRDPDGNWVGFDIDVGTAIAEGLGVTAEFQHQDWEIITAGTWNERWDLSVGSMTITTDRKDLFSFATPYYFTPAYMAASERSGVTSADDLPFEVPDGVEPITRPTDANCIEDIQAGRTEFDLLITSGTVIDAAVEADQPIVKIGEPIYTENLSVALDKAGPTHAALLYEIDQIIQGMHEDGTLTSLSEQWFEGEDLTQDPTAAE
ncbi:MAG TPA: transporter substrate-binding domain-containing protein [Candidatus Limnocylindria bacterium]|jgi:polar amino acid transport system substrate-binding protein